MKIVEVKTAVDNYREWAISHNGVPVAYGEGGPASIGLIDKLVAMLEFQQEQIDELKRTRVAGA